MGLTPTEDTQLSRRTEPPTFPSGLAAGITVSRTGPAGLTGLVPLSFVQSGPSVIVTFPNSAFAVAGGSLIDGLYTLNLNASAILGTDGQLDGDSNGIPGGNSETAFFRLFGDANGDRRVDAADFLAFRLAILTPTAEFDFDGDGIVDGSDFLQFRLRFLQTI